MPCIQRTHLGVKAVTETGKGNEGAVCIFHLPLFQFAESFPCMVTSFQQLKFMNVDTVCGRMQGYYGIQFCIFSVF
jgi:hypothetical protein